MAITGFLKEAKYGEWKNVKNKRFTFTRYKWTGWQTITQSIFLFETTRNHCSFEKVLKMERYRSPFQRFFHFLRRLPFPRFPLIHYKAFHLSIVLFLNVARQTARLHKGAIENSQSKTQFLIRLHQQSALQIN